MGIIIGLNFYSLPGNNIFNFCRRHFDIGKRMRQTGILTDKFSVYFKFRKINICPFKNIQVVKSRARGGSRLYPYLFPANFFRPGSKRKIPRLLPGKGLDTELQFRLITFERVI